MSLLLLFAGSLTDPSARNLDDSTLRTLESGFSRRLENNVAENLGMGGYVLDGRYGSTTGVDTNDPLLLRHTGTNYLYLSGVSGNYASVPDATPVKLTGDLEIVWRVACNAWSGGTAQTVIGKWDDPTNQRQYMVRHESTPVIRFYYSTTGANFPFFESNTLPLVNGVTYWFKVTWNASTGAAAFFYAADQTTEPTAWTSAGTPAAVGATTLFNGTAPLLIGSSNAGAATLMTGKVYRSIIRNGIGGTTVFDVDFTTGITSGSAVTVPYTGTASTALESVRTMSNLGTAGPLLNASLGGSPNLPTTNDPLLLRHTGTNYLYLAGSGAGGSGPNAPDLAAYTPSTSLDIRIAVALDSISGTQALVGHYTVAGDNRSWVLIFTTNTITLYLSTDGINITKQASPTIAPTMSAGVVTCLRATWTASPAEMKFWQKSTTEATASTDLASDAGWTQLGSTITSGVPSTALFSAANPLVIGSQSNINFMTGKVYRVQVRTDGSTVFDADFTALTSGSTASFTESSTNAATVSINRATSGRKNAVVTRSVWLFGTDDYMEVTDNNDLLDFSASESFTVLAVVRQWATGTTYGRYVDKKNGGGSGVGWSLSNNTSAAGMGMYIGDGTNQTNREVASTAGSLASLAAVVNRSSQTLVGYVGTTTATTTGIGTVGSMSNTLPMRIGSAANAVSSNQDFECFAVAVFRRALSAGEISTINDHYQGTVTPASTVLLSQATFWIDAASSPQPVVSINRSTTGGKSVAVVRNVWLFDSNDYFNVIDNALLNFGANEDFTLVVVERIWATPANYRAWISKYTAPPYSGYQLRTAVLPGLQGALGDGSSSSNFNSFPPVPNATYGNLQVLTLTRTGASTVGRVNTTASGPATGTGGNLSNTAALQIGGNVDSEVIAVAIFRRALSASEIASIVSYYGGV